MPPAYDLILSNQEKLQIEPFTCKMSLRHGGWDESSIRTPFAVWFAVTSLVLFQ